MSEPDPAALGDPDLALAGLSLWVHRLDRAEDWIDATLLCVGPGALVWTTGSFLRLDDLRRWRRTLIELWHGAVQEAVLDTPEGVLRVELRATDALGHLRMRVELRTDPDAHHVLASGIDQSYLPELVAGLEALEARLGALD